MRARRQIGATRHEVSQTHEDPDLPPAMHKDIHIGGVLISAFVAYALGALAVMIALRWVFARIRLGRYVANPPLFQAGLYMCVLAVLVLVTR